MLAHLLGSKSAADILLFLLVNHKGYATQIAQALALPQTPIQKGLDRLEKAGIIVTYRAGRTKLYQMNPTYPLKAELEKLLLKTFTLLPADQKGRYLLPDTRSKGKGHLTNAHTILDAFWQRLKRVTHTVGRISPQKLSSEGVITVTQQENSLLFQEKGQWQDTNTCIRYTNTLRWRRHWASNLLSLEHLRYGNNHPVFLFYLVPTTPKLLESSAPHLCQDDSYTGTLKIEGDNLILTWNTLGPNKRETIESIYS